MKKLYLHRSRLAFTLVELLVVIGIIALLASLALPNFTYAINKAQSTVCEENLRGIGAGVLSAATDNGGVIQEINQTAPPLPYGSDVGGLIGVLGRYGVSTNTIQCPTDLSNGTQSSFAQYGSSYEWNPVFDDGTDPVTAIALGGISIDVNAARIRLCTDFVRIHHGKMNALYGDGHTRLR